MILPRIIHGTDRPHTLDVALSDEELRALLALCDEAELRPAQAIRQALRVYQASRQPPDDPSPFACPGRASP